MIDITGVDLRKFVKEVYDLSSPQGMGILHFKECGLDDKTVDEILNRDKSGRIAVSMDYVNGRACKMVVWREIEDQSLLGRLTIRDQWYDHSKRDQDELLMRCGIEK